MARFISYCPICEKEFDTEVSFEKSWSKARLRLKVGIHASSDHIEAIDLGKLTIYEE